jgi:hypothetical protein
MARVANAGLAAGSFPPGRAAAWAALFATPVHAVPRPGRRPAHSESIAAGGTSAVPWAAVLALTLLAAVLRAIGLDGELWLDEMYAAVLALRNPFVELITVYNGDNQHPLFSLFGHAAVVVFGDTPWAMRLPAFLFGVASVPLLVALGARVADRREALLAAALLAVSYHHVWFSQNARGYTMLAFWTILSTVLLLRGIREGRRDMFLGYAAAVALGIFTHLTMVFLVAAHVLICAWLAFVPWSTRRLDWRLPLIGFVAGGLLTLALYGTILTQLIDWFVNRPSRLLGVSTPAWAVEEGLRILRVGLGGGWTVLAGGLVFAIGLASYLRQSPLVFALFVLPGVTTIAGALLGRGTMYPRFFFFLIGFALLIVVRGAIVLGRTAAALFREGEDRRRLGSALGGALVALMIVASALSLRYNYSYPKQAFRAAAAHVEANASPADPVAVINATWYAYIEFYGKPWVRLHDRDDPADDPVANLARLRAAGHTVWLVYTFPRYLAHEAPGVMRTIRDECGGAPKFDSTVGDGDVFACALPPTGAAVSRTETSLPQGTQWSS